MLFVAGDDLIGIEMFFFQFLMVAATLQGIPGADVLRHGFIEFVDSEYEVKYLLFSLDLILFLLCSMKTIYLACYKSLQIPLLGPETYFCCFLGFP